MVELTPEQSFSQTLKVRLKIKIYMCVIIMDSWTYLFRFLSFLVCCLSRENIDRSLSPASDSSVSHEKYPSSLIRDLLFEKSMNLYLTWNWTNSLWKTVMPNKEWVPLPLKYDLTVRRSQQNLLKCWLEDRVSSLARRHPSKAKRSHFQGIPRGKS